jgi:hypothetical protein
MPHRQFSVAIVGGSWPLTDPQNFHSAAEAQHANGAELINSADELRRLARGVAADQSGHFIDGFCGWCNRTAGEYVDGADEYFAMARVSEEVGRLLYGLREDLDDIDCRAHEDIQRIQQSMGVGNAVQAGVQMMAIVTKARTEATAKAGEAAAAIEKAGMQIGIKPNTEPGSGKGGPPPPPPSRTNGGNPPASELGNGNAGGGRPLIRNAGFGQTPPPQAPPKGGAGGHQPDVGPSGGPPRRENNPPGTNPQGLTAAENYERVCTSPMLAICRPDLCRSVAAAGVARRSRRAVPAVGLVAGWGVSRCPKRLAGWVAWVAVVCRRRG